MIVDLRKNGDFQHACRELAQKVASSGIRYDVIIAVATGGVFVGKIISESLGEASRHHYGVVKRQRRGTKIKERVPFLSVVLAALPGSVKSALRIVELCVHEWFFSKGGNRRQRAKVEIDAETVATVKKGSMILVIDDALDSGNTLLDVLEQLSEIKPDGVIHTAVLAVTYRMPLLVPTYSVFKRTIVKCPWSLDS